MNKSFSTEIEEVGDLAEKKRNAVYEYIADQRSQRDQSAASAVQKAKEELIKDEERLRKLEEICSDTTNIPETFLIEGRLMSLEEYWSIKLYSVPLGEISSHFWNF